MSYDIENVALLARLKLSPEEKESLGSDFSKIIAYVQKLNSIESLNDESIEQTIPMTHVHQDLPGYTENLRADETKETLSNELALRNSSKTSERAFETPLIVEQVDDE